ncbi:DUF4175 family protein [Pontibacter fetidus]|uniref:DUF4175 family protein n=1 Tax=Pontibacter fetidus TaxID=2700082 RepID=A0A6B2GY89_9BACT|nr:DUF4175 family protein [Pontibacter fetidus]NDK54973.1 DUF4175 family protein [Pontibacter fetidus]
MSTPESIHILHQIRGRYVRAKLWLYALQALAAIVVGLAILWRWQLEVSLLATTAVTIVVAAVLYFVLGWRAVTKTSLQQVARHLNRQYPQLQDSTELLLKAPENLLQQLQQQRVAATLQQLHPENEKIFTLRSTATYTLLGVGLLFSAGILYLPAAPLTAPQPETIKVDFPDNPVTAADTAVKIEKTEITVTPPAYTGKGTYRAQNPNLLIEQGATVSWRISTTKPAILQLQLNEQQPINFKKQGNSYSLSRSFTTPGLYTINLNGQRSAFYTLEIIPDEAPTIAIQKPEQYTEILFGQPQRVTLQAQLTDDYGIREANMVATVAKGTGEAVKFREEKINLNLNGNPKNYAVKQTLDLQKLGMTYGDELYFYLQAWDRHRGYTRSETYFVQIEDTTIVDNSFDLSMGVNPVPEYFRSQRQIIIDTEKLLKEQKTITRAQFEERANNLGVDQKLLRLRYGKFLGEEFESGIGPGGGIPEGEEHYKGDGHDHKEFEDKNSPEALLDPYMHKHDQEGEATIFEPAVKAKLKGALAQMWDAELRLRTHKPKDALPYEYKALRMLKEVQQSQRAYVAKTGFEAPPLKEPELRLTGELNKITAPSESKTIVTEKQLPQTKAALQWLATYKQTGKYKPTDAAILEKAGQELARQTLQKPGSNLKALRDLRMILTAMQAGKTLCKTCLVTVERAWVNLLPPATPTPQSQQAVRSRLSQQYLKQLNQK